MPACLLACLLDPLAGFRKPIVMTGSQLPLSSPRSDARQNLIDALTCATASYKVRVRLGLVSGQLAVSI
jgi:L-asparaginase/Glu-tRNA(Gln) amidotransferase subunit D